MSTHASHGHHDADPRAAAARLTERKRSKRLGVALVLNLGVVVAQVVVGLVAHSIGLLSDASHNLTDVAALGLSIYAVRLATRAPTERRSFGWHRSTILAAQANAAMILVLSVAIVVEAVRRLDHPPDVDGFLVVVVALVGFRPALDHCAECLAAVDPLESARFHPLAGGTLCERCARGNGMSVWLPRLHIGGRGAVSASGS